DQGIVTSDLYSSFTGRTWFLTPRPRSSVIYGGDPEFGIFGIYNLQADSSFVFEVSAQEQFGEVGNMAISSDGRYGFLGDRDVARIYGFLVDGEDGPVALRWSPYDVSGEIGAASCIAVGTDRDVLAVADAESNLVAMFTLITERR